MENHNTYSIRIEPLQNITPQSGDIQDSPIYTDDEGNTVCNVAAYMIIYNEDNKSIYAIDPSGGPFLYVGAKIDDYIISKDEIVSIKKIAKEENHD